jgi:MFS family permease
MAGLVLACQIGSAAFHPSAAGAATTMEPRRAGFMLGVFLAGGYLGYAFSQLLFTAVHAASPAAAPLLALLPVAAAGTIALAVPRAGVAARRQALPWAALRQALPRLTSLFAVQLCASAVNTTLIFLLPDLLHERQAARWLVEGGGHFALVAGGGLALLPAGHASDRWGARRVLLLGNAASGLLLLWLLSRGTASAFDLLLVLGFGAFNGVNSVVAVAEGSRVLPGHASGVSALLMGLPWCLAAAGPVVAGILADPGHGGSAGGALGSFALLLPAALAAAAFVRPRPCGEAAAASAA